MADEAGTLPDSARHTALVERAALLADLEAAVERLLAAGAAHRSPDLSLGDAWTVRDVVGHLAFWHESFARNVDDLVHGRQPSPLRGRLADLNDRGVAEMRALPFGQVIGRLRAAQATIAAEILSPELGLVPYRVGSRAYSPADHLEIVRDHVIAHARQIERAVRTGPA